MKLAYALLCDTAFLSIDRKMNIIGIFDHIMAPQFPTIHPGCCLAMCLEISESELGVTVPIKVVIVDPDGATIVKADIEHPVNGPVTEGRMTSSIILAMQNITLPEPGEYELHIWVEQVLKATLPLTITSAPPKY